MTQSPEEVGLMTPQVRAPLSEDQSRAVITVFTQEGKEGEGRRENTREEEETAILVSGGKPLDVFGWGLCFTKDGAKETKHNPGIKQRPPWKWTKREPTHWQLCSREKHGGTGRGDRPAASADWRLLP